LRRKIANIIDENPKIFKPALQHFKHPGYLEMEITGADEFECKARAERVLPIYKQYGFQG
jgi:3-deoxy-D-arabino-heptulosonate 7-phosphate (DAHP) synthase class II